MTVVADRGFGYMELFERLEQELGFAYIIRFKGNILVGYPGGEQVPARDWLTPTGRTEPSNGGAHRAETACRTGLLLSQEWHERRVVSGQ